MPIGSRAWLAVASLCLALFAGSARAAAPDQALGLVGGGGILGHQLSGRTYYGLVYDRAGHPAWAASLPGMFYLESNLARWHGCSFWGCGAIVDAGLTPIFRWEIGGTWYEELGIGVHLIDHTRIGPQVYSTAFQFGELAGLGCRMGEAERYELELRVMHESNADLKIPNDGMTFLQMRAAVHW